jgi:hypothetical protein
MSLNPFSRNSIDRSAAEGRAAFTLAKEAQYGSHEPGAPLFYRMVVVETIHDPAALTAARIERFEHELGVANVRVANALPRNSIVARRILDGTAAAAEPALLLFPFLPPHFVLPSKPGEHVWAMFESPNKQHDVGWWLWRISEPHFVDDVNHTHAPRAYDPSFNPGAGDEFEGATSAAYEFRNGRPESTGEGNDRYTVAESALIPGDERAYEKILSSAATSLISYETVPRFRKRPGDVVLEGSNNALIVIGTDRAGAAGTPADPATGAQQVPTDDVDGAGAIDIVVGRGQTGRTGGSSVTNVLGRRELAKSRREISPDEGDPDMMNDRARIYIAQASKADANLGLTELNSEFEGIADAAVGDGTAAIIADKIRILGRSDVEIISTGFTPDPAGHPVRLVDESRYAAVVLKPNGDIILRPGSNGIVKLGADDADQHVVLGDDLLAYLRGCVNAFNSHLHVGESTPPGGGAVASMPPAGKMSAPTSELLSQLAHVKKKRAS